VTARRFEMEVQPQLVLLQKTLLNIEGLGRQLYPELDLWATGKPYLEKWVLERRGPKAIAKRFIEQAPLVLDAMPYMPMLVHDYLKTHRDVAVSKAKVPQNVKSTTVHSAKLLRYSIAGGSLVVSASLISGAYVIQGSGVPVWFWVVGLLGVVLLARGTMSRL